VKGGQQSLALDKKFEEELRNRSDVPKMISKLRKMAATGNMEQGKMMPFSLGFVTTPPDATTGVEAPDSEQQPFDNANNVTPHTLQLHQDEAANSAVLPSTASKDSIASVEEQLTTPGQNESMVAETATDAEHVIARTVQIHSPSPLLTAGGWDGPNLIHSTASVNTLPSYGLVGFPAGSDPETDDNASGLSRSETPSTSDHGSVTCHSPTEHVTSVPGGVSDNR
jgi:hypothetical protein